MMNVIEPDNILVMDHKHRRQKQIESGMGL